MATPETLASRADRMSIGEHAKQLRDIAYRSGYDAGHRVATHELGLRFSGVAAGAFVTGMLVGAAAVTIIVALALGLFS